MDWGEGALSNIRFQTGRFTKGTQNDVDSGYVRSNRRQKESGIIRVERKPMRYHNLSCKRLEESRPFSRNNEIIEDVHGDDKEQRG